MDRARPVTVLVVEDDGASRANICLLLELEGFATLGARNGADGLAVMARERPDIVLCDIMMPDMDGHEMLAAVRNGADLAATPFIFLTGLADPRHQRIGMNGGADDYLTKPVDSDDLVAAIGARLVRMRDLARDRGGDAGQRRQIVQALSVRELEIFDLIGAGLSSKAIATRLSISLRTVDSHRAKIIAKLDLEGTVALVGLAARLGG